MHTEKQELGEKLLGFLHDIHERNDTPESCDVDDLLALFSLYMSPEIEYLHHKNRSLEQSLWVLIKLHDKCIDEPCAQNDFAMRDAVGMIKSCFRTEEVH